MANFPVLVLGTANRKKGRELADLFSPLGLQLKTLADFGDLTAVEENGETFADNAKIKAIGYAKQTGHWVLADDSGLMVDALDGAPGVFSARYAGPGADDKANNQLLLENLQSVPAEKRSARFVCHIALADNQGTIRAESESACRGRILSELHGVEGFGYDPLFEIPEYHRTFAEFGLTVKSVLSHRARACRAIIPALIALLDAGKISP